MTGHPKYYLVAALFGLTACVAGVDNEELEQQILEEATYRGHEPSFCDRVFTLEHEIDVGDGAVLRLTEKLSPASVLRFPRRALLMLPGTLVTGDLYDADVDSDFDYSALDTAAREGFFSFAVTYEGYPGSSQPADGSTVTAERTLEQLGTVIQWIRSRRRVRQVDLMGSSIGSSLATNLGGTLSPIGPAAVGRIVLMAHVYKSVTPLFQQVFFSPEVREMLENAPNGYILTAPEMYGLVLAGADPQASAWAFESFPGVYATGPTLEGFDLPVFDASHGVAPAMQFWGTLDLITPIEDVEQFEDEYGGSVEVVILPEAGHAPHLAVPEWAAVLWSETFEFLDYDMFTYYFACKP